MARATSQFQHEEHDQPASGEWQDLRSELVALLDEVETQHAAPARTGPVYEALAERVRDLRHQVAESEPDTRHREALRSVQRAINRFNDRDDAPATPRETLDAAIRQIRARHTPAANAASVAAAPRIDHMAQSAEGISTRLERLEGELRLNARSQSANVKEIADQIAQLSQVVELLAGAVGEVGQVKRLESQIASLASILAEQPQPDLFALNARLDEVSASVLQFSEIAGIGERLDDVSATVARLADLQSEIAERPAAAAPDEARAERIESGIRNLYDRIDAIESKLDLPQPELDGISAQLSQIAAAIKAPQQPQGLIELIDALNTRVAEIESRSEDIGALHADLLSLRETVVGSLEPRFTALESHLDKSFTALGDRVIEKLPSFSPAPLEAQVRQLVARMDQTGEQLTGLAKLYAQPAASLPPDIAELADLVAEKASAAIARDKPAAAARIETADIEEIERRVTRIMADKAADGPTPELAAVEGTIREVNDRLARIEAMLTATEAEPVDALATEPSAGRDDFIAALPDPTLAERRRPRTGRPATLADKPGSEAFAAALLAPEPASVSEPVLETAPATPVAEAPAPVAALEPTTISEPADGLGPLIRSLADDELLALAPQDLRAASATDRVADAADAMPASPADDAPLLATPFPDPADATESSAAKAPRHPGLATTPDLPPKPFSALDEALPQAAPEPQDEPVPTPLDDFKPPSRNTFIEAHRRAARMATSGKPAAGSEDSLIGRAFSRFQAQRDAAATQPVPPPAAPTPPETAKPSRFSLKRAARAPKPDLGTETKAAPDTPAAVEPKARKRLFSFASPKDAEPETSGTRNERRLAGDKISPTAWLPDDARAAAEGVAPAVSLAAEATAPAADGAVAKESFLLRHRRPILLGASVIAIACLAVNLINQRLAEQEAVLPAAEPATVGDAALSPTPLAQQDTVAMGGPRIVPMVDQLTTGSVSGTPAQAFAPTGAALPETGAFAALQQVAALEPVTLPNLASPAIVDIPPENVGPQPLRAAAAAGDPRAQFEVAAIYTEGRAIPENLAEAAVWYERAASQGFAPAQYRLGTLYEHGNGVEKDLSLARLWYQRAAEAGNRLAMHNLAALYAGGELGTQQFDAAAKWFEEAAGRGMKDSQFNLGMLYARGLGVTQDLAQSYKWFGIAASRGDADAAKARDDMAASLDAATVRQLNEEVAAWRAAGVDLVANFAPIGTWESKFDPGRTIDATEIVRGVQLALSTLGFDVGTPDGLAGPKTADAIRSFERATGMSESGAINPRLLAVLGSQPV